MNYKQLINFFQKLWRHTPANADDPAAHARSFTQSGHRTILIALGLFMLWATTAPIDRGVTATGWVIADGQRKSVQTLQGGAIRSIYVKEGDLVQANQLLIQIDPTTSSARVDATNAAIQGLDTSIHEKQLQLQAINKQVSNMQSLAKDGYVATNRVLELERLQHQTKDALVADQSKRSELQAQLPAAIFDADKTEIRSPVEGFVVDLSVFTEGGVLQPATKVMDIVPSNNPLVVSGELPVHLIDKVSVGLPVDLMFTAFNQNRTPHIPGVLTVVAKDRTTDPKTGVPFYRIQVMTTQEGKTLLGNHQIKPGMPVDIFIKTGERTLLSYLLKPIWDRAHSAMRED